MAEATEQVIEQTPSGDENFAQLLEESLADTTAFEGTVVKGTVLALLNDEVLIDVGLKAEGRIPLREFGAPGQPPEVRVGDIIDVFVERLENRDGEAMLSREKARREEAWNMLERAYRANDRVTGSIFGRVKGGFTVDLSGAVAFLPGSQVDIRPIRDIGPLMGTPQPFQILKMDRQRGNIVVSRRAVLEETRAEARAELIANLREGQVHQGVVKNITDYGAFIDLGGIDGLLHVTDISWRRVNHPTEALQIGETVEVKVIRFNPETQRISLGMKQLQPDPWEGAEVKYPVGVKFEGRVTNITDYGAFVELEPGIEGLVHVSGDELDQEEHPSGQDHLHLSAGGGDGARGRFAEAPYQPGHEAVRREPVGRFPGEVSGRHRHRGRRQEHHRVRPVRGPAGRNRRHGTHLRSVLGEPGRGGYQGLR